MNELLSKKEQGEREAEKERKIIEKRKTGEENKEERLQVTDPEREEALISGKTIQNIFDKVFKKILTLSSVAVINLINGLFGTAYPSDSMVTYNWTEFEDDNLRKILADTIITINGIFSYHIEAQISKDNEIIFRVFDYGFGHANRTRKREDERYVLRFPKPVIIYLYYEGNVPDEYTLTLEFDEGTKQYEYRVPVIKLPEISVEELNDKKMVILIPFHLLKLRDWVKKGTLSENPDSLKKLLENDIIGSINKNLRIGNITQEDALKLKRYTQRLCEYLYSNMDDPGLEVLKDMTDESFMTDIDILCKKHEEELTKREETIAEKEEALMEKDKALAKMNEMISQKDESILKKLISQVCWNYQKGKSPELIAEELVEPSETVEKICKIVDMYASEYDVEKIYEALQERTAL